MSCKLPTFETLILLSMVERKKQPQPRDRKEQEDDGVDRAQGVGGLGSAVATEGWEAHTRVQVGCRLGLNDIAGLERRPRPRAPAQGSLGHEGVAEPSAID